MRESKGRKFLSKLGSWVGGWGVAMYCLPLHSNNVVKIYIQDLRILKGSWPWQQRIMYLVHKLQQASLNNTVISNAWQCLNLNFQNEPRHRRKVQCKYSFYKQHLYKKKAYRHTFVLTKGCAHSKHLKTKRCTYIHWRHIQTPRAFWGRWREARPSSSVHPSLFLTTNLLEMREKKQTDWTGSLREIKQGLGWYSTSWSQLYYFKKASLQQHWHSKMTASLSRLAVSTVVLISSPSHFFILPGTVVGKKFSKSQI